MPEKKAKRKATKSVMMKWGPERLYNALSELGISFYVCRNGSLSCDARKGIITGWIIEVLEAKREKLARYIKELAERNHALDLARRMIAEKFKYKIDKVQGSDNMGYLGLGCFLTLMSIMEKINDELNLRENRIKYDDLREYADSKGAPPEDTSFGQGMGAPSAEAPHYMTVREFADLLYGKCPEKFRSERVTIRSKKAGR